jgi:glycerophosphoryl diester phosphodiesterase
MCKGPRRSGSGVHVRRLWLRLLGIAPENSLKGLKACQSLGVKMVEGDIHKTKDGVLVIMHDNTLDRMTNLSGPVKN